MKIGKIHPDQLQEDIIEKINYHRQDILLHAGIGEDCAVIDFGDQVAVISSDPITGATEKAGYLAVHVACNDLAATGAEPVALQVILLLPETTTNSKMTGIMEELHTTSAELQVEISGGHTEVLSSISQPLIIITAIGRAGRDSYVATGGARAGDQLLVTKGLGIEGTYILATDYRDKLLKLGVSQSTIDRALDYEQDLSVLSEGLLAAKMGVHAMHDITEGGLYGALEEVARASGRGYEIYPDQFVIRKETAEITHKLGIDPAGLISSGSMLIATDRGQQLVDKLAAAGIKSSIIGKVRDSGSCIKNAGEMQQLQWSGKDELWRLMDSGKLEL